MLCNEELMRYEVDIESCRSPRDLPLALDRSHFGDLSFAPICILLF